MDIDEPDDDAPKEELPPGHDVPQGIPQFRISQDDMQELERIIPALYSRFAMECEKNRKYRSMFVKLKRILSDVRWDYGPYLEIEQIDC